VTAANGKRGITIFRAQEAVDVDETDFLVRSEVSPGALHGISASVDAGASDGSELRLLVRDAGGFSLLHAWFKANFPLPRHTHNADCMYYVISGSAVMGSQVLRAGDSFFVPAGAPYQYSAGPEGVEVLEVRHGAEQFDITLADVSPARWQAMAQTIEANRQRWAGEPTSPTFVANAQ